MCKGKALALITGAIHRVCGVECLFRLRRPGQADSAQLCEVCVILGIGGRYRGATNSSTLGPGPQRGADKIEAAVCDGSS